MAPMLDHWITSSFFLDPFAQRSTVTRLLGLTIHAECIPCCAVQSEAEALGLLSLFACG
jgi:hypothetical protein